MLLEYFSCTSNTRFQVYTDRRIVLRAQVDIKIGEEVSTLYLPPSMGTVLRRTKIKNNWKFDCVCDRCSDKTEFGTNLNTVKCQLCVKQGSCGYILPLDPLEYDGEWECQKCNNK